MFLYNVYRVGCEVSPLLLNHGSQCLAHRFIFKTDPYFMCMRREGVQLGFTTDPF